MKRPTLTPTQERVVFFNDLLRHAKINKVTVLPSTKNPAKKGSIAEKNIQEIIDKDTGDEIQKCIYSIGLTYLENYSEADIFNNPVPKLKTFLQGENFNLFFTTKITDVIEASIIEHCIVTPSKRASFKDIEDHAFLHLDKFPKHLFKKINGSPQCFKWEKKCCSSCTFEKGSNGIVNIMLKKPSKNITFFAEDDKSSYTIPCYYIEKKIEYNDERREYAEREIQINQYVSSAKLEGCVNAFAYKNNKSKSVLKIYMEYFPSITLEEMLKMSKIIYECNLRTILLPICKSLEILHKNNIVYRDLKPSNILVYANKDKIIQGCLIDFGLAKATNTPLTTLAYNSIGCAPEQKGIVNPLKSSIDIYSLGKIIYLCLFGDLSGIFEGEKYIYQYTCKRQRGLTLAAIDLLQNCLQLDPKNRFASMADMIKHKFFNSSGAKDHKQSKDFTLTSTTKIELKNDD